MIVWKTCPRCKQVILEEEYGSQRWCQYCWRDYNRERQRTYYKGPKGSPRQARKWLAAVRLLPPEDQEAYAEEVQALLDQYPQLKEEEER